MPPPGITTFVKGLGDDTPFFTLTHICDRCDAVVLEREIDVRTLPEGAMLGEEDGLVCADHLHRHEAEDDREA